MNHSHTHTQTQIELSDRERKKTKESNSFKYANKHAIQRNKHILKDVQKKTNKKAIYLARVSKYNC
jgi:hypothetical protein